MKKRIILMALVFIGSLFVWFVVRDGESVHDKREARHLDDVAISTQSGVQGAIATNKQSSATANIARSSSPSSSFFERVQRPIEFFGKVVDQNNLPVAGAKILMNWNQFVPEQSIQTNLITDESGLFSLRGVTGASLGVYVQKDGYYPVKSANQNHFDFSALLGSAHTANPTTPVVFYLRKKGEGADLITSARRFSRGVDFGLSENGRPVRIDLLSKSIGPNGELLVTKLREPKDRQTLQNNWYLKMEIPDGGFLPCNEEFPFEAPRDGYSRSVEWRFTNSSPWWKGSIRSNFFFKFGIPPKYGFLTVASSAFSPSGSVEYVINPDGSRNLEPK